MPNIVLVDVDTLRADEIGVIGPGSDLTPNIDRWARGAVVFRRAYSTAPWTVPSQTSLLTSLYPSQHGEGGRYRFCGEEEIVSLPELLGVAGYETVAFHEAPLRFFTERFTESIPLKREEPFTFDDPLEWIEARSHRPFFMLIHTMEVHDYMTKDAHALEAVRERFPDYDRPWLQQDVSSPVAHWPLLVHADASDVDFIRSLYREEIRYLDEQFGRFLEALEQLGLADETIVLLVSDHGEGFDPEHRRVSHAGRLHEDLVRVPLIWSGPELPAGVVSDDPVGTIDVVPTLLTLVGAHPPETMRGVSLFERSKRWFGWFESTSVVPTGRPALHFEETLFAIDDEGMRVPMTRDVQGNEVDIFGIVVGASKYIHSRAVLLGEDAQKTVIDRSELYDLALDPEERNLIRDAEATRTFDSLLHGLRAALSEGCTGEASPEVVDPEVLELLRSLGYIR